MGKKKKSGRSSSNDADAAPIPKAAFVLKVPMHCRCDGCGDKIRAAVKDLTLRCDGILSLDQSALPTRGELAVVATADPERLRRRLRKATGKNVGLVFPKPPPAACRSAKDAMDSAAAAAAASVQAMLAGLLQQQLVVLPAQHGHTWNALQHGGGQVQQLQQAPYMASSSYPAAASYYPAGTTSWGAYPHDGGLGGAASGGWLGF